MGKKNSINYDVTGFIFSNNLLYYFVGIDKARFKKPVLPGDVIIIEVKLTQSKKDVYKFDAVCKVENDIVCTAELLGAVRDKG